jgi:3-polyprenyl-4-hydroxybenzoate decarboxylase
MAGLNIITLSNLGTDFDIGTKIASKINVVASTSAQIVAGSNTSSYFQPGGFAAAAATGLSFPFNVNSTVGIGTTATAALLNLAAGTTAKAPLLFTSGTSLTTPTAGTMEYDGTNLFFTPVSTRRTVAFLDSPTFTGVPAAPTASQGNNSTQLATTAYVDVGLATKASLVSPAFTGVPTAPTAATNTSTTQLATTAFVTGQAATVAPLIDGTATIGTSLLYARQDHIHPTDTTRAPTASPTFTGTVTMPAGTLTVIPLKLTSGTNLTTPVVGAVEFDGTNLYFTPSGTRQTVAFLASPAFTGTPTAPNATYPNNTTQIATTAFVTSALTNFVPTSQLGAANGVATLDGTGRLTSSQLPASIVGGLNYQGVWNASANSPTLTSGTGTKGYYYKVSVAGSTDLDGTTNWNVGDMATYDGTSWDKLDGPAEAVTTVAGRIGAVVLAVADVSGAAPLASPTFTGTPISTTAAINTNTTQIATTQFVIGQASTVSPNMDGTVAIGTSLLYARADHTHPTNTALATNASPTFTGTVTLPTGSTAAVPLKFVSGTSATAPVAGGMEFDGTNLYFTPVGTRRTVAFLDNPAFTGVPTAPTASYPTSTTQIATTAFVSSNFAPIASPTFAGTVTMPAGTTTVAPLKLTSGTNLTTAAAGVVEFDGTNLYFTPSTTRQTVAFLASPAFSGIPTAPTASYPTSTTQIATTAFVSVSFAPLASPALTGVPTAPTASFPTSTTQIATTAYVAISYAPLSSPALTGVPTAPTAATSTNTTQVATTQFVLGQVATVSPIMDGSAAVGASLLYARQDHVHPSDTSRAPIASPTFTGTVIMPSGTTTIAPLKLTSGTNLTTPSAGTVEYDGTNLFFTPAAARRTVAFLDSPAFTGVPTAPTASQGNNSTQLATTAYTDIGLATKASLVSPAFTGVPTAPTAAQDTATTQLATTAFVTAQASAVTPAVDSGAGSVGTSLRYARADHFHPFDPTTATLASPAFTGIPTAPTAVPLTSTAQLATTAYAMKTITNTSQLQFVDAFGVQVGFGFNPLTYAYVAGNQTANIVVTASASLLTGTVANLVNGSLSQTGINFVNAVTLNGTQYIQFDFGLSGKIIYESTYYQSTTATEGVWQWSGSNDGSSFTNIGSTFTLGGTTTQVQTQLNGNIHSTYQYYRLTGVSGTTSSTPNVQQFQFSNGN